MEQLRVTTAAGISPLATSPTRWWLAQLAVWSIGIVPALVWPTWLAVFGTGWLQTVLLCLVLLVRRSQREPANPLHTVRVGADAPAAPPPKRLRLSLARRAIASSRVRIIVVSRLKRAIALRGAEAVLAELFRGARPPGRREPPLIESAPPARAYFALVSYRQERLEGDDSGTTMDAAALASIADVAHAAGLEGIWLDACCFAAVQNKYDHDSFVATLAAVTQHASEVIWLPRARTASKASSYQFRLWCTFEAATVAERGLPVRVAGVGLSQSQLLLHRFGTWTPLWPGCEMGEVRKLQTCHSILLVLFFLSPFVVAPLVWVLRAPAALSQWAPKLSHEYWLCESGQSVLRVMLLAAEETAHGRRHGRTSARSTLTAGTSLGGGQTCTSLSELRCRDTSLGTAHRPSLVAEEHGAEEAGLEEASLEQLCGGVRDSADSEAKHFHAAVSQHTPPTPPHSAPLEPASHGHPPRPLPSPASVAAVAAAAAAAASDERTLDARLAAELEAAGGSATPPQPPVYRGGRRFASGSSFAADKGGRSARPSSELHGESSRSFYDPRSIWEGFRASRRLQGAAASAKLRNEERRRRRIRAAAGKLSLGLRHGLPWLPCYDRRDVLVVAQTLDRLARRPTNVDEMRAVALSAFVAAIFEDAACARGRSLRQWLEERSLPLPGESRAAAGGAPASWMDCAFRTPATIGHDSGETLRMHMQEGASGERARGDRVRPAEPPPRVPLPSLRAMGWALQRGASTLLTTPVGSILLPASQSGKEAALSLDQCCLERWENVLRIGPVTVPMWWLVLTASGLMFVAFFQFYLSFALGLAYRSWEYVLQASCILTIFASAGAVLTFLVRASKAARSALAFGLTPHDVDIAGRVQPEGYGIKGLLLMRLSAHAIYGFVVLLMFEFFDNVLIAEGLDREAEWAPFKQAGLLGGYHDLPPHRRWNVISVVVFIKMCEMQSSFAPTSQVFHMWHRGRGLPAFWPRSEKDTFIE